MGEPQIAPARSKERKLKAVLTAASLLILAATASAHQHGEVTPLFRDDAPIDITLSGPIRRITSQAERSTEAYPATLQAEGETLSIELSARGLSRRRHENCHFPPLRVDILGNPDETSLFDRQGKIKLVTHCNDGDRYEQNLLREYAAYRLYNLLTPDSFKVRLLRVTYMDQGEEFRRKWGFFIEDIGDAARRLGRRDLDVVRIPHSAFNPRAAARFSLFQYMIGNTDWAMTRGPASKDCCHNAKIVGGGGAVHTDLIPLPYDFDNAGLVDAPYAVPNPILPIHSVTQRHYRGFCSLNQLVIKEAEVFRQSRPEMGTVLATIPGLSEGNRRTMLRYLDDFFEDIATPASIERNLLSDCR